MHNDEIQGLLTRFGFSVTIDKKIGETTQRHMIQVCGSETTRLVDYVIDEAKNSTKTIWAYTKESLKCIENVQDLESWLNG